MRGPAAPVLLGAAALLLVVLFFGGGSSDGRLFWIGAGVLALVAVCGAGVAASALPRPSPTRLGAAFLFPDGARLARLRNPVGYWNALGLAADLALPLFLWLAPRRRDVAALGIYLATVALLLTYSRGGVVVGALAVAAWLAFGTGRREN